LRGVSFGNFLIKQVVEELKAELPQLKRFATLSPVPGFCRWLADQVKDATLAEEDREAVEAARGEGWWKEAATAEALKPPLLRLAATYLTRPAEAAGFDPVAKFHLGNGARLERVNWLGNTAPRGMRESLGIMVNYLYDPDKIEANHEAFVSTGTVARSPEVDVLMRKTKRPAKPAPVAATLASPAEAAAN
jgi:malonyl-CoA decarboxylase